MSNLCAYLGLIQSYSADTIDLNRSQVDEFRSGKKKQNFRLKYRGRQISHKKVWILNTKSLIDVLSIRVLNMYSSKNVYVYKYIIYIVVGFITLDEVLYKSNGFHNYIYIYIIYIYYIHIYICIFRILMNRTSNWKCSKNLPDIIRAFSN